MKQKYYSLKKILSENADYNIIIGERSNGKSYACLKKILDDYIKDNKQGAYIRRFKEDITSKRMNTLFTPFDIEKITNGKYHTFIFSSGAFYFANIDENRKKAETDSKPFCFAMALVDMEHNKSTSYPDVRNILFDEFLTRTFYLKDEFILFMNTISTIARDRTDIKIFMCGNTVNNYSPYFEEMGITNIKNQKQDTIDIYTYSNSGLKVAVEYCGNFNTDKKSNKFFAFNNPKLQMITHGKWEIGNYPHLPQNKRLSERNILYVFYIGFNGDNIQFNIYSDNDLFIYVHKKTTPIKENELFYSLDNQDSINLYYRENLLTDSLPITNKLKNILNSAKIFYSTNEIGEIYRNYVNACKRL